MRRMITERPGWIMLFLVLLSAPLWTGCTGEGQAAENTSPAEADADRKADAENSEEEVEEERVPVETVAVGRGRIEAVLRYSTNLEAESQVEVFSQAARVVRALLVEEGDNVRKGQVLLRLQDDEQKSRLAQVQAQLAKAEREYERQQRLFAQDMVSEQAMNDATYEADQLRLQATDAERELAYTEVRAPISGTITNRLVNLGDTITVNQHLFDLVDFDSIVARLYVPERELPNLELGQEVRLISSSLGGEARRGQVIRIAPVVDPKSGTVKVTVGLPKNQGLLPGMYVEAELVTSVYDDALLVPKRAVVYDNSQAYVFKVSDDQTVQRLLLRPKLEDRAAIAPQEDVDLGDGDRIVVAGQAGLKNGALVRVLGEEATEAADAAGQDDTAEASPEAADSSEEASR